MRTNLKCDRSKHENFVERSPIISSGEKGMISWLYCLEPNIQDGVLFLPPPFPPMSQNSESRIQSSEPQKRKSQELATTKLTNVLVCAIFWG